MTRYKVVEDYGNEWGVQILEHYYTSLQGQYRNIPKAAQIYAVEES